MQLAITRKEIRRRILARLGNTTSDEQAQLVTPQYNEFIRAACEEVYTRCAWVKTLRESRADIGIDQRFVNYPANCGPENIMQLSVWDEDAQRFIPLRRGLIPQQLDDEPVVEIGEPGSVAGRGRPTIYEPKTQIELWRRADKAYRLKIDHTINPNFEDDNQVSVVDGELIILWAMADAFDFSGDPELAKVQRQKFQNRLMELAGQQGPQVTIRRDAGRSERLNERARGGGVSGYQPNSGAWPSVMPEA